jgi:threonine dehydratase
MSPEGIERAEQRLTGHVRRTPLFDSPRLSAACGVELLLKHEYQQVTGSFKERGACNRLLRLSAPERERGVVAASAGNHALGLAYHGQRLGIPVHVVMPRFAPMVKVAQCRTYGAVVELVGESFDEARARASTLAKQRELTLVPGFDDPDVIEGQGTLGLELLAQLEAQALGPLDAVIVPVGGGGLLAGLAIALKSRHPELEIIGVEAAHAPTLSRAREAGRVVPVRVLPGLADGLAVARIGEHCLPSIQEHVSSVECVEEAEIASALLRLMEVEKAVVEGAGAVGLAWLLRRPERLAGRRVAVILSGGNIDLNIAARVIERGLGAAGRLCRVAIELADHPGALARLLGLIASTEANLIQVHHDRNFGPTDVTMVSVSLVLETRDAEHIEAVRQALSGAGLAYRFGAS